MMDAQPLAPADVVAAPRAVVIAAAGVIATAILMLPAVLNGFPFLFYDSGGYLEPSFSHVVVAGRSTIYGLLLRGGSAASFWPIAIAQSALCVWTMGLVLRVHGLGGRPGLLIGLSALLSLATALPFVSAELMPDVFAGVVGLALYLLLWRRSDLRRGEAWALAGIIAIGGASHNSVLAIALLGVGAGVAAAVLVPSLRPRLLLRPALAGIAVAALLNPIANLALAGRFTETPGGTAFIFGRLLEDGMVTRYLQDHCPQVGLALCAMRDTLPRTADDFLWDDDEAFNALGGFEGGAAEMRRVVVGSLTTYPVENLWLALRATLRQMVMVQTGDLMSEELTDSYDVIRARVPAANAAMVAAWQQQDPPINFDPINLLHVPVALAASLAVMIAAGVTAWRRRTDLALLTGSVAVLLLANAAVCGVLSNPHDRYQARIAWVAVLVAFILLVNAAEAFRQHWPEMRSGPAGSPPRGP